MQEVKTGDYFVKNGKLIKVNDIPKNAAIRLVTNYFSRIDLSKFENCYIDVFNGYFNVEIRVFEVIEV